MSIHLKENVRILRQYASENGISFIPRLGEGVHYGGVVISWETLCSRESEDLLFILELTNPHIKV